MIDVFVRMATAPAVQGVVAESMRWGTAGQDPTAVHHQVVTLYGDPSVTHLAWAVAAANRGAADLLWQIAADGSAVGSELSLATSALHEDAAALLTANGAQLRSAVAHLQSVRGQDEHSAAIRVPLSLPVAERDGDAMLALLREAEGDPDLDLAEDELAA
jgi:hypothetical protein